MINLWLRYYLYRDTALVPAISFVTGDIPISIGIAAPIKLVPRSCSTSQTLYLEGKTYAILSLPACACQAGLHRDSFAAKVSGPDRYRDCPDAASSNPTSLYCRPLGAIRNRYFMMNYSLQETYNQRIKAIGGLYYGKENF